MNHLRLLRADGISHRHQADWRDIRLYWRITTSSFPPPARSYTTTRNKIFSTAQRLQLDFENFIFFISFPALPLLFSSTSFNFHPSNRSTQVRPGLKGIAKLSVCVYNIHLLLPLLLLLLPRERKKREERRGCYLP